MDARHTNPVGTPYSTPSTTSIWTAASDHVKAVLGSKKTMAISFDEWNIWYNERFENVDKLTGIDNWPVAPRLLEDIYTVTDAVVFGSLLISLLKHADRVTSASLAQLVNVIAPIMTEPGGPAWRQTTFYPFAAAARNARGTALRVTVDSPSYDTDIYGEVPVVDAVATIGEGSQVAVYLVNRSQESGIEVVADVGRLNGVYAVAANSLYDADPLAANTLDHQDRVRPRPNDTASVRNGSLTVTLPPVSWTEVVLTPVDAGP